MKLKREEFLATLITRGKLREAKDNMKVLELVLIVDQNDPLSQWHLIREEEVFRVRMDRCVLSE